MNIPAGYKFATSDEWVRVEGDIATVGVSDFAQDQLSDVVFVEISVSVGEVVTKGGLLGTVESVKAASDINLPVSGTVTEINEDLPSSPELVNTDPYGKAWMIKLKLNNAAELNDLMDDKAYSVNTASREH
jgi:glycine cleavage system H protein